MRSCRDIELWISSLPPGNPKRTHLQGLLRRLQDILIEFQSYSPTRWIDAGLKIQEWLNADEGVHLFDFMDPNDEDHEEGEEKEEEDDDDIDPQDFPRDDHGDDHGDGHDGGE